MQNGKEIISILGKPNNLLTFVWYVSMSGVIFGLLKNPIFDNKLYDYLIPFGVFVVMAVVGILLSIRAKKENRELDIERGIREKDLEDHKTILATNLEKEKAMLEKDKERNVVIGEATQKIREWIANPPQETETRKYPFNYGVELEYKVTPTGVKSAILHVEGRPAKRYRLN